MWIGFLLAVLTGLSWTAIGIVLSFCARKNFDVIAYSLAQTLFCTLLTLAVYLHPGAFAWKPFLLLAACIGTGGFLNALAQLLVRHAMTLGCHGPVWAISQSALVIPFLAGVLLFGNAGSAGQWIGTALIACGILIPACGEMHAPGRWLVPTLVTFLLFGIVQTLYLVPSQLPGFDDASGVRPALASLGGFAGWCLPAAIRKERTRWDRRTLLPAFGMALLSLASLKIFFLSLDRLSTAGFGNAAVPLIVGANILGFAIYSRIVLKERPTRMETLGMTAVLGGVSAIAS